MDAKGKREFKKLHDSFLSLREKKRDPETGKVREPAIDHGPYEHLHEEPDVAGDLTNSYCPICHQDYLVKQMLALVEAE